MPNRVDNEASMGVETGQSTALAVVHYGSSKKIDKSMLVRVPAVRKPVRR